jgi:hypothetical protein
MKYDQGLSHLQGKSAKGEEENENCQSNPDLLRSFELNTKKSISNGQKKHESATKGGVKCFNMQMLYPTIQRVTREQCF